MYPPPDPGAVSARGPESRQQAFHVWDCHDKWKEKNAGKSSVWFDCVIIFLGC